MFAGHYTCLISLLGVLRAEVGRSAVLLSKDGIFVGTTPWFHPLLLGGKLQLGKSNVISRSLILEK